MTLKELLRSANANQKEIAELLGVSQASVSQWATGKTFPRTKHLFKLAKYFKVDVNKLVDTAA